MKFAAATLLAVTSTALFAQNELRGQSAPPQAAIETSVETAAPAPEKPSAATPYQTAYTPGAAPTPATSPISAPSRSSASIQHSTAAFDPDANIVTSVPAAASEHPTFTVVGPVSGSADSDPDAGIVTRIAGDSSSLPIGTILKMHINTSLSTDHTLQGSTFTGAVSAPVERDGQVLIPAGASIEGRVTEVRGGRRIGGAAALHLTVRTLVLPDGTRHTLRAQVIDSSESNALKVDNEGTLLRRDHAAETLAVFSLTTGGAAAAGAVLGGGVGALVGAGVGAGISTAVWLKQDHQTTLPKDSLVVLSLTAPFVPSSTNSAKIQ